MLIEFIKESFPQKDPDTGITVYTYSCECRCELLGDHPIMIIGDRSNNLFSLYDGKNDYTTFFNSVNDAKNGAIKLCSALYYKKINVLFKRIFIGAIICAAILGAWLGFRIGEGIGLFIGIIVGSFGEAIVLIGMKIAHFHLIRPSLPRAVDIDEADFLNNEGNAFAASGNSDKALERFNQALMLNPFLSQAYNSRAILFKHMTQYQKAFEDYNHAIAIDSTYHEAYANRGVLHELMGRYDLACADYKTASRLGNRLATEWHERQCL